MSVFHNQYRSFATCAKLGFGLRDVFYRIIEVSEGPEPFRPIHQVAQVDEAFLEIINYFTRSSGRL